MVPFSLSLPGDTPFEFLTYQLGGRIVAYHGYNGYGESGLDSGEGA